MPLTGFALCLLTLLGSLSPARAARDLAKMEAEFAVRAERAAEVVDEMKAIRTAFPGSGGKAAQVARMAALTEEFDEFWRWEEELIGAHSQQLVGMRVGAIAVGFNGAARGEGPWAGDSRRLQAFEDADIAMRRRAERLVGAYKDESGAFGPMRDAYLSGRAAARRWGLAAGAVAVLLSVGALLYVFAGGRRPPPAPAALPAPGSSAPAMVAGNFELVRLVGRGSMGEVFEAVDKTLDRRVALKRLRKGLLQDPVELERLLAEARVMAALKHPNMVAIYGAERHAGEVYLALEFVDGGTLEERLGRERRLSWSEALRVLEGAGAAVDYAHSRRVIHRDIKPANIMLSGKGEAKVADFGIAYQAAKSVSRLTRAPSWGTPPYMAPEQELGGLSAAVDRYALAVCLFEAVTGELPFKGPNFLAQKREQAWEPPSRLVPGLPVGVDELFRIAFAPEPGRRFPTAAALTSACRALRES